MRGTKIVIGDRELTLAPMNLDTMEAIEPRFGLLEDMTTQGKLPNKEQQALILDIIHASVLRNHSDVTREWLKREVDVGNIAEVLGAALRAAGLEKKSPGEG